MTMLRIEKVGLVADYSMKGDWALRFALPIARSANLQLNVFSFLESPYSVPLDSKPAEVPEKEWTEKDIIAKDRELREYYDSRLGDYVEVGFRVCESARHNLELKRCLIEREYQIMIVPYLDFGIPFGNMPIEEFAYRFNAPLVLVGPTHEREFHCNAAGSLVTDALDLPRGSYKTIERPKSFQELAVI